MKRIANSLLTLVLVAGVCISGYAGFQYFDTKAKEKAAQQQADALLENREIPVSEGSGEPTLLDKWNAKKQFEPTLRKGEAFGKLKIPKLKAELPIVEGVDPADLSKGVGHDEDTMLPLDNGQIVLSGHRDTVFRGIGKLEIGDTFVLSLPYGDFEYRLSETKIVKANDRTIIVPHDYEVLTVTTCYPFNYVGNAPNRYIMTAEPMFDMDELLEKQTAHTGT